MSLFHKQPQQQPAPAPASAPAQPAPTSDRRKMFKADVEAAVRNGNLEALADTLAHMDDLPKSLLDDALTCAVKDCQLSSVKLLLEHGAILKNVDGQKLRQTVYQSREDMFQFLVQQGIDFEAMSSIPGGEENARNYNINLRILSLKQKEAEIAALKEEITGLKERIAELEEDRPLKLQKQRLSGPVP